MCKCLYCYQPLQENQKDFHPQCAKKIFGVQEAPLLEYKYDELDHLAEQVIRAQTSLTGVQPKLSLNFNKHEGTNRLTIVGLWGDYIFKPQTADYPQLPENEDLTMHLAECAKIKVVPHSLIRLTDGSLGYITKRIDRTKEGKKIDMEDMCQLTLHPTEYKYKGSYEQIAKVMMQYCDMPKLDLTNYMQLLLFCFVTGNNDMHLKNFSLYRPHKGYQLSPAYDLVNIAIANPNDKEELALSLSGRKTKIELNNFIQSAATMGIEENVVRHLIANMHNALPKWRLLIQASFLDDKLKEKYTELVEERLSLLQK
jgi:hypothetical protein